MNYSCLKFIFFNGFSPIFENSGELLQWFFLLLIQLVTRNVLLTFSTRDVFKKKYSSFCNIYNFNMPNTVVLTMKNWCFLGFDRVLKLHLFLVDFKQLNTAVSFVSVVNQKYEHLEISKLLVWKLCLALICLFWVVLFCIFEQLILQVITISTM